MRCFRERCRFGKNRKYGVALRNWVLGAAAFLLTPAMALAIDLPPPDQWVQLVALEGWCLETVSGVAGSELFRRPCDWSNEKQQWRFVPKGTKVWLRGNATLDKCITIKGGSTKSGIVAVMKPCVAGYDRQKFKIEGGVTGKGPFLIRNEKSGLCLEYEQSSLRIVQLKCNITGNDQKYSYRYVKGQVPVGVYVHIKTLDGRCLETESGSTKAKVWRRPCDDGSSHHQQWIFKRSQHGGFYIKSRASGDVNCLTNGVVKRDPIIGDKLYVWTALCNTLDAAQRWRWPVVELVVVDGSADTVYQVRRWRAIGSGEICWIWEKDPSEHSWDWPLGWQNTNKSIESKCAKFGIGDAIPP